MTSTELARSLLEHAGGLLIDLDGTLVDSSAPVGRAWAAFADRHGLDPAEVLRTAQGRPSRETVRLLAPAHAHATEEQLVEEAECTDTAGTLALPGAEALLRSGRRLAIVTSCSARLAGVRLRAAGLQAPAIVISGDDVIRGKPDPECFEIGARALGLTPGDCLVLEDSPAGIAAARAAGAPVVAIRSTHQEQELAGADAVIDDLRVMSF
jgi:mannitol-1-/sugar-/sorbitol-6-phosphatase